MLPRKIRNIPFRGFHTHACVYGDLNSGKTPIILIHGGPGGSSCRYEPLSRIAEDGTPVIFYDQLGCGYSRVPKGHLELWTTDTYLEELENLIEYFKLDSFVLLGHSWGGMIALLYALSHKDPRLKGLILYSTLPSTKIWNEEHLRMMEALGEKYGRIARKALAEGSLASPGARRASAEFYKRYVKRDPKAGYRYVRKRFPRRNDEIYHYMWGPSELFGIGTLKDYDVTDKLGKIKVPTLIMNGELDESTEAMNELMRKKIKGSVRHVIKGARHGSYAEKPDEVVEVIRDWYGRAVA